MGVIGTGMLVVLGTVVFGDVVAKVFHSRVPLYAHMLVRYLVHDPKVAHFHGTGPLAFDCAVGYTDHCGVVAVDWGRRLRVAHLVQDKA